MSFEKTLSDYFLIREYGENGKDTIFLFGGWGSKPFLYRLLIHSLTKRGFRCILYLPVSSLIAIGTQYAETVYAAKLVIKDVQKRISLEKKLYPILTYTTFGISFGTLFAMECAKQRIEIRKIILISPFGDFAKHVLLWPKHRYFGKVLASQKTSVFESGEVLNRVGPTRNLHKLKNKEVFICYSTHDTSVHSAVTDDLLFALQKAGINTKVVKAKGGHFTGIIKHLLLTRVYLSFLLAK